MLPCFLLEIFDRIIRSAMIPESQSVVMIKAPEHVTMEVRTDTPVREWLKRGKQVFNS